MVKVTSLPDNVEFEVLPGQSLLDGALGSGVAFTHACGGRAKCSTCRIWVEDGLEGCGRRNELESAMADRLGLTDEVRLACQLRPENDLQVRRLVIDETDLMMCSQLDRAVATRTGEAKDVTIFFSDVSDFTSISERLSPYDVMYLLNRYYVQVGDIIERNGGFIDKFVGDGLMAVFGIDNQPNAPLRAVSSALDILAAVDQMKPFFKSMYDADFDIRIGLHYGEAVLGSLGSIGHERLTAIGDVVNVASRVEAANKDAGTRLLISDALHEQVSGSLQVEDFIRVRLRGTGDRITLHEINGLTDQATAALQAAELRETILYAGKKWVRGFAEDEIGIGDWRILAMENCDIVVLRHEDGFHAFNNACSHINLPLFDTRGLAEGDLGYRAGTAEARPINSEFTSDRAVVCRWHHSCFDLQTGEVRDWAARLGEDGTMPGWEFAGDVSKNRHKLTIHTTRLHDGVVWVALE
jgi:class 3 adenylate cyclase/nitrite reductase/ring-hydroxylating ferredoxin subunit